jgi:hypothetical protein
VAVVTPILGVTSQDGRMKPCRCCNVINIGLGIGRKPGFNLFGTKGKTNLVSLSFLDSKLSRINVMVKLWLNIFLFLSKEAFSAICLGVSLEAGR